MNKLICVLYVVISIISGLSNAQPADLDPAKIAATVASGATDAITKGLNTTKSIIPINPADIATKGASLIPMLIAACQSFMSQIIGIFSPTTPGKLPGMDIASNLVKTSTATRQRWACAFDLTFPTSEIEYVIPRTIIAKPIEIGQGIVKDALKILSPPSESPAKAPAATKDTSGAKPDIAAPVENIGQNVVGSVFKAFGLF